MPDRNGKEIKEQVLAILQVYEDGYKDKFVGDPYFDGVRATIKNLKDLVVDVKLEL